MCVSKVQHVAGLKTSCNWSFNFLTNLTSGNWNFSESVQLQLVVQSFAVGFSSVSVISLVQWTEPLNTTPPQRGGHAAYWQPHHSMKWCKNCNSWQMMERWQWRHNEHPPPQTTMRAHQHHLETVMRAQPPSLIAHHSLTASHALLVTNKSDCDSHHCEILWSNSSTILQARNTKLGELKCHVSSSNTSLKKLDKVRFCTH